jgi:Asp-tRNA(Asn)/Glu-tRNA(Gln) amidotransferase A subunit family amidase
MGKILKIMQKRNLNEFFQEVNKKELLKDEFADKWHSERLDAMISPVLPFPAIRHGDAEIIQGLIGNTFIYNVMGMPSGVVPIRNVRTGEEFYETKYNDLAARKIRKVVKETKGLPLTVQVATFNYEDELCLSLMKKIEKYFDYHLFPEVEM